MRKLGGTLAALAIGGTLLLGGRASALAQDATPIILSPSECVVALLDAGGVDAIVAIWNAEDYAPDADIAAGILPTGTPASDDVVAAVDAILRQLTAC